MHVRTDAELKEAMEQVSKAKYVAIDTEFLREKTYYPLLCLIQIATEDIAMIIDPLADIEDYSPLADVLTNPDIVKILHASRQDREMLFNACGVVPNPIFDTQIAAPLLGYQQQISLKALVEDVIGVKLAKTDSLTDWSKRPLKDSQVEYSLDDVRYLIPLYHEMRNRLLESGRLDWVKGELEELGTDTDFGVSDCDLWRKVKKTNGLSRRQLAGVSAIAIWRENSAKRNNIPRRWILSDELVVEIAKREPKNVEELNIIRGAKEKISTRVARELIQTVQNAVNSDSSTWPVREKRKPMVPNADSMADMLSSLLRTIAKHNNLSSTVLATHDDLMALASGQREGLDIATGWRYEIAGRKLIDLLDGKVALIIKDGNVQASEVPDSE